MLPLLLRIVDRFRPREGWLLFLLTATALLCVPSAILFTNPELGAGRLFILALLGTLLGLRLARSRLRATTATLLSALLGAGLVVLVVGRLLPPLSLLWGEIENTGRWLGHWPPGGTGQPIPFASTAAYVWQRLSDLGVRLWWWGQTAASGVTAHDRIVLTLSVSYVVWTLSWIATWQIYRRKSALLALVPTGAVLTTVSFFGGGLSVLYLFVYLLCTLSLAAAWHLRALQDRWQQTGTDYPGDLGLELGFALAPILVLTLGLGAIFPVLAPHPVSDAFWRAMDGPWSAVEQASERLFGPIQHTGGPVGPGGRASLPRAHLLGGSPELGETIALYVTTSDPPPPPPSDDDQVEAKDRLPSPRRYWRAATYDTYTGRGWTNGPLEARSIAPSQPLEANVPPGADLVQEFELLPPGGDAVYAVNAPLYIDQSVEAWLRGPGDLAQMTGSARQYVVISHPPEPTAAQLRQAPPSIPAEVADRYLALPDTVPQEVLDLAQQVGDDQPTRYDQSHAIEIYLRAYPYTLDLPDPPANRDLVDYFLFYLQEGYCDYYASAMVVMARAIGIPARLATGYAQGTYDYDLRHWVVTELDGHTWVEVYFDGFGWVEFEPTAGLPAIERPGGEEIPGPAISELPPRSLLWWQRVQWLPVGLLLALISAVAFLFWLWHPALHPRLGSGDLVRDRYHSLLRWGARLKEPIHDGQTVSEYARTLGEAMRARGQNARLAPVRRSSQEAPDQVQQLADAFSRVQYAPGPVTRREALRVRDLWLRLRRHLARLWLAGR
jgi:transglutaminase-like putative cysteine protease